MVENISPIFTAVLDYTFEWSVKNLVGFKVIAI